MNANLAAVLYLVAGVLFILSLRGLSSPASSRQGNFFGMIGMAIAITMPIMPNKLPWREEAGLDSPRSDRMNRTPATRYSTAARLAFIGKAPL